MEVRIGSHQAQHGHIHLVQVAVDLVCTVFDGALVGIDVYKRQNYDYVGFSNYITLIRNRYFQQAFLHTFQFTAIYVTGANVLGLGLALLLNRSKWYTNIARTVVDVYKRQVQQLYGYV